MEVKYEGCLVGLSVVHKLSPSGFRTLDLVSEWFVVF